MRRRTVLALSGLFSLTGRTRAAVRHKIEGFVLDPQDQPIDGVSVSAYRGATNIDSIRTDSTGHYVLQYDGGDTINAILYEESDRYPAKVAEISGRRDHTINKVMYRVGTKLSAQSSTEVLGAYQTIAAIGGFEPHMNKYRYTTGIESLDVPPVLASWKNQVKDQVKTAMEGKF